jgi:uncharacterized protein YndB with AHSA1/START domain
MADIMHQISIAAPAEAVYRAITTRQGLAGWWTDDVEAEPEENSVAVFGFNNHAIVFRMRIETLVPSRLVLWSCEGDADEWTGTWIRFEILPAGDGDVVLQFTHGDWRSTEGDYRVCNTHWGRLMYCLKDTLEGRGTGPMMG